MCIKRGEMHVAHPAAGVEAAGPQVPAGKVSEPHGAGTGSKVLRSFSPMHRCWTRQSHRPRGASTCGKGMTRACRRGRPQDGAAPGEGCRTKGCAPSVRSSVRSLTQTQEGLPRGPLGVSPRILREAWAPRPSQAAGFTRTLVRTQCVHTLKHTHAHTTQGTHECTHMHVHTRVHTG